ncbi:hypothetical protein [Allobaculum sp. Allo2]|uniref:hypothetical protein n=1 Tax=Allobaculum sp. Allo2 TaxID=2853432 RepID=UPI001F60C165|nr:hypothetical protein [Allobaculum sp. Allo2]UNT93486.1 hypothetical protein KWG61_01335 [Allobaculum sp. Allo2]
MKIRDLLAIESIDVHASAADKNEIIRKAIDLMEKAEKSQSALPMKNRFITGKKKVRRVWAWGSRFPMAAAQP